MNRNILHTLRTALLLALVGLWGLTSCNDDYSSLGGSLRPERDLVTARGDSLRFTAETVLIDSIYSRSDISLLGQISDPIFGDFEASYISRLQCAPGFTFSYQPLENRIDSVTIELTYLSAVGDTTTWGKAQVYEITQPLPKSRYSTSDLTPYLQGAKLLGELTYLPSDTSGRHGLAMRVPNELGERFLRASREHPEWFATQEAFESHLLRGLYVTSTTGTGHILSVYSTALRIFYTFETTEKSSTGEDSTVYKPAWEVFSNNKSLYALHSLRHSHLEELLQPSSEGRSYIKSPAGVVTKLTCTKEELSRLLHQYEQMSGDKKDFDWVINEAKLQISAETPNVDTRLNPPPRLLLIPKDSVLHFFASSITNPLLASSSFVSGSFSVLERNYTFSNVSHLIEAHMRRNMVTDADGSHRVTRDLEFLLIPVATEVASTPGSAGQTVAVINLMYPSAVQLQWGATGFKLGVIGTGFYNRR